jgi:predicted nucleic-acid-binding Zn-ribbon protein
MPINEYIYMTCNECGEKFFLNESIMLMEEMVVCPGCGSGDIGKDKAVLAGLKGVTGDREEEISNGYV